MALTVFPDVDGSSTNGSEGRRVVRTFLVYDIPGPASNVVIAAETADDGSDAVPPKDDPHPQDPTIRVLDIQVRMLTCNAANVDVVYGRNAAGGTFNSQTPDANGPTVIRGSFRLKPVQRVFDKEAIPNLLALEPPQSVLDEIAAGTRNKNQERAQVATITTFEPTHVLQHERLEDAEPADRISQNIGKRNSFTHGIYPPGAILFMGADYRSADNGLSYQTTYFFDVDVEDLHRVPSVEWRDPDTGAPHPDNATAVATGKTHPSKRENLRIDRGDTDLENNLSLFF